jgi:hypothetical protein
MEVAHDEVAVVDVIVDGGVADQDPGQAADQELRDERQREQHRRGVPEPAAEQGAEEAEVLYARGMVSRIEVSEK